MHFRGRWFCFVENILLLLKLVPFSTMESSHLSDVIQIIFYLSRPASVGFRLEASIQYSFKRNNLFSLSVILNSIGSSSNEKSYQWLLQIRETVLRSP